MNPVICEAIRERRLLRLNYHWGHRIVEPHAYGLNDNGHELLRVFQVSGASESGEHHGWKLLRVDEIHGLEILKEQFEGSRPGYKHGDKAMDQRIYCQL
ncbi:hypothetical protein HZA56_01060 [Candidatus Poribacteria bacterium]|nr:hypothetical protein [Candidatus Poribacteria bacterium]